MALINCPSCSQRISDQANYCPQCGHPLQPSKNVYITNATKGKGKNVVGIIIILFSLLILGGSGGRSGFGVLLLLIGIGVAIYGKIEHWWHWK